MSPDGVVHTRVGWVEVRSGHGMVPGGDWRLEGLLVVIAGSKEKCW